MILKGIKFDMTSKFRALLRLGIGWYEIKEHVCGELGVKCNALLGA